MFFYWDYYLLGVLLIPGLILSIIAQTKTTRSFENNSHRMIRSGKTASELARQLLDKNGLQDIKVSHCRGNLTDNYNPRTKTVSLSDSVYNSSSVAAIGVMAHELGHVLQHKKNYAPIKLRMFLVPVINISSALMWPLTILGLVLEVLAYTQVGFVLICVGIGIFALSTLFSLITVPVEKDASKRAYNMLLDYGIVTTDEGDGVKEVLNAAALTYVAALVTSILSLLRFVLFILSVRNRD